MDSELKRQLDIEAQETFVREQAKRKAELDRRYQEQDWKEVEAQEAELKRKRRKEQLEREREQRLWEAKEKIKLTTDLSDYICRRIASGEMLKAICAEDSMPTFQLVQQWFDDSKNVDFHAAYLRACNLRDRAFEDEIVIIADDSSNDFIDKVNSKTGETFRQIDPEALTRSKMRIDARLRIMKANNPSRWGDNPNAGEATRKLLENMRPVVQISFIEAPKDFAKGSDARVTIEHQPTQQLPETPPWECDKDDVDYLRRRDEKAAATKTKVA